MMLALLMVKNGFNMHLAQIVFSVYFSEHIEMAKKAFKNQKNKVSEIAKEQEELKVLIHTKRGELATLNSKISGLSCLHNFIFNDNGKDYSLAMKILKKDDGVIEYREWEHLFHVAKICNREFLKNGKEFLPLKKIF